MEVILFLFYSSLGFLHSMESMESMELDFSSGGKRWKIFYYFRESIKPHCKNTLLHMTKIQSNQYVQFV